MLTEFGEYLNEWKMISGETTGALCRVLGCSQPFISAVMHGRKSLPDNWYNILVAHYNLSGEDLWKLNKAIAYSASALKIDIQNATAMQKKTAFCLQENLLVLNDKDANKIINILTSAKKGKENMNKGPQNRWVTAEPYSTQTMTSVKEQYSLCNGNILSTVDLPWSEVLGGPAKEIRKIKLSPAEQIDFDPFAQIKTEEDISAIAAAIMDEVFCDYGRTEDPWYTDCISLILLKAAEETAKTDTRSLTSMFTLIDNGMKDAARGSLPEYLKGTKLQFCSKASLTPIYSTVRNRLIPLLDSARTAKWSNGPSLDELASAQEERRVYVILSEDMPLCCALMKALVSMLASRIRHNNRPLLLISSDRAVSEHSLRSMQRVRPSEICWIVLSEFRLDQMVEPEHRYTFAHPEE